MSEKLKKTEFDETDVYIHISDLCKNDIYQDMSLLDFEKMRRRFIKTFGTYKIIEELI